MFSVCLLSSVCFRLFNLFSSNISGTVTTSGEVGGGEGGVAPRSSPAPGQTPVSPAMLVQHYLANPEELAALQQRHPHLAQAILSGDLNWVMQAYQEYQLQQRVRLKQWEKMTS